MRIALQLLFSILSISLVAQNISIQGVLRDPNGRTVDDGTYSVIFSIYDVASSGTALWTDTYENLQVNHGVFQASLGEDVSLDGLAFDTEYHVGVTVENFAEMTPRIPITIYPYAKAILGQDNQFPSTGNIVLAKDSIIVEQGALKFEGPDGRIVFNDGTSLNTANFSGPASALLNPSSININADKDDVGAGAINFQIGGTTEAAILNDGTLEAGPIQSRSAGGDADTLLLNPSGGIVLASSGSVQSGSQGATRGFVSALGGATAGGGVLEMYLPSDQWGTLKKYFWTTGANSNLYLGTQDGSDNFANRLGISPLGYIGLGGAQSGPQFELALGDTDTGIDWISDGDLEIKTNGAARMKFTSNGAIGLGSSSTRSDTRLFVKTDGSAMGSLFLEHTGSNFRVRPSSAGSSTSIIENSAGPLVLNPSNHNVGIGTTNTGQAKLVIGNSPSGGAQVAYAWSTAVNPSAIINWNTSLGFASSFSVWADGNYGGSGFLIASDKRIKEIIGRSDNFKDLELIKKIKITDYSFTDKVKNGGKVEKKVIAQEVAEVFPQAVNRSLGVIPNIYEVPKTTSFSEGLLKIELNKAHQLKVGDRIQCYVGNEKVFKDVRTVEGEKVFIVEFDHKPEAFFVYGQEVDDFHTVDYDAISMLNVSATQELAKQVETLQEENKQLKKQLESMKSLEARLSDLEVLLKPVQDTQLGKN